MNKIILAYIPVLHRGYKQFLEKHEDAHICYVMGPDLIQEFTHLSKEIRALEPSEVCEAIQAWSIFRLVEIAGVEILQKVKNCNAVVVMPDEDICHELAERYFPNHTVVFDPIFLRWDKKNSLQQNDINPDRVISENEFDREMIGRAIQESEKSSDWWRQVGAVIVRKKEILLAGYNRHVPSPHMPYVEGDPRNNFKKGLYIELGTALHAEKALICEAAKHEGTGLAGADLYVTTFPCPPCAKAVAYSGIQKCYYREGYAMLDGERILKAERVEIILVR